MYVSCTSCRYHSGTPREGWGYAWPNTGQTPLVDVQNSAGFTPLHYAVWVGRKEAIQVGAMIERHEAGSGQQYAAEGFGQGVITLQGPLAGM